jgi:3-phosphoshikimate 1-carboxyvinyltransferase
MSRKLCPARRFGGTLSVPGDKSIAHRAALLSILSRGPIRVTNFATGADCKTSLSAAQALGVAVTEADGVLTLTPPESLSAMRDIIVDCGNSGTTARLSAGIIAGSGMEVTLTGDASLSGRPMKRIIEPLTRMGAELFATDNKLPMRIRGKKLLPFEYHLPVASAQVKSCLLLAGLASSCSVTIREDVITRDHTERMLEALGTGIVVRQPKGVMVVDADDPRKKRMEKSESFANEVKLNSSAHIIGGDVNIPGDISTAAFFWAVGAISGKPVTVTNVGLNPTRTAILDHLKNIGCVVTIDNKRTISGEPRGDVTVQGEALRARKVSGETTVGLIDEIPIVAVMAAFAEGTTLIRNAEELKVKESDRLAAIAENMTRMGAKCGLLEDGLAIEGGKDFTGADFVSHADHRIAMAFSVASLFLVGPSSVDDADCVGISCPEFFDLLPLVGR